jgi:integrase
MTAYVYPKIGHLAPSSIEVSHLMQILSPIWTTKHETATRVRSRIEQVLDYCRVMGFRSGENPARYQGNLKTLLPAVSKREISSHHPSMLFEQVPAFMTSLRQMSGVVARALEFTILTAARSGETRGATWEEIQGSTWVIPKERMKAGVEHHVPLSRQALAVLKRMSVTVHGFRSSFRIWCSETSARSFGDRAAEFALAHGLQNKVEASYQRSTLFELRVQLMQAWSDYCDKVAKPEAATVTDITSKVAA